MHKEKPGPTHCSFGIAWFNSFVKRNNEYITYTIANNVAQNHAKHCTEDKFHDMYNRL